LDEETLNSVVSVEYDSKADAMYIWLRRAKYDISEELAENVILDLDKNGHIIGIEVLDASKNLGKELVTKILQTEKIAATA
jgi:uncharacterized protein YuzE